jgi:Ca2+-transporting ATPase
MSEVLVIFAAQLLGVTMLKPAHLLWINMVTDSAPGLALGMEKAEAGVMDRKPRSSDESIFAGGAGADMIWQGVIMASLIVASFFIGEYIENGPQTFAQIQANGSIDGMTMAFLTCNFIEMFEAIDMRTQRGNLFGLKTFNWWLLYAFLLTSFLTVGVVYIPFLKDAFGLASVSLQEFLIAFGLAFVIIPLFELIKALIRLAHKKEN